MPKSRDPFSIAAASASAPIRTPAKVLRPRAAATDAPAAEAALAVEGAKAAQYKPGASAAAADAAAAAAAEASGRRADESKTDTKCTNGKPSFTSVDLLTAGPWLAAELGLHSRASGTPSRAEVLVDVASAWPSIWAALPAPTYGVGPHLQYFGLWFGELGDDSLLRLGSAELCPPVFEWDPLATGSVGDGHASAASLELQLTTALEIFLESVFLRWVVDREAAGHKAPTAWMVCNDGEAFTLSAPLRRFGKLVNEGATDAAEGMNTSSTSSVQGSWRSTVVVVDRSKSSPSSPALEVMALNEATPRRLIYDIC